MNQLPATMVEQIKTICHAETPVEQAVGILRSLQTELAGMGIAFGDVIQLNLTGLLSPEPAPEPPSSYTWIEFINAGTQRMGKSKGFQQAFLEANTDFSWGDMSKWRRTNKVPAEAMALVKTLIVGSDAGRGQDWTDEERNFLGTVLDENPKIEMIVLAGRLTTHFGRVITEGAAKAAKKRLLAKRQA